MEPAAKPLPGWTQRGTVLFQQQQWDAAAEAFRESVQLDPKDAIAWCGLGAAEQMRGNLAVASEAFQQSLALNPGDTDATIRLAFLFTLQGQPQQAAMMLQELLSRVPHLTNGWLVLGHACEQLGGLAQAEVAYRRAVELDPQSPRHRYQWADVLLRLWRLAEAESCVREILVGAPHFADAWALLGLILRACGAHQESLAAIRQSLALAYNPLHHSKFLAGLQYAPQVTPEVLLTAHREWERGIAPVGDSSSKPAAIPGPKNRPLRLGFISADFAQHPLGFLALPALESFDKSRCSIVCYSDRMVEDDYTIRFRRAADQWRIVRGMSDSQVATLIREDEVDILFDLSGHVGERLSLFANKTAPLQVTWLGYVGTTGLTAIDYLLADRHHVRPGEEGWYAEKVLRMPHGYACYGPPVESIEIDSLPALPSGHITFGCFNNPAKFSSRILDAWSMILQRVAGARLLVKFGWLDDDQAQRRLREEFCHRGVAPDRIMIEGNSSHQAHLAAYQRVDLALDTQPYSGGLTTCEALWMGVPVITFPGSTFAGRHSTSHLINAGYGQFVAADLASYVELAVAWASRINELAGIRREMRDTVRRSALCNAPQFADDFLTLFEHAWQMT